MSDEAAAVLRLMKTQPRMLIWTHCSFTSAGHEVLVGLYKLLATVLPRAAATGIHTSAIIHAQLPDARLLSPTRRADCAQLEDITGLYKKLKGLITGDHQICSCFKV